MRCTSISHASASARAPQPLTMATLQKTRTMSHASSSKPLSPGRCLLPRTHSYRAPRLEVRAGVKGKEQTTKAPPLPSPAAPPPPPTRPPSPPLPTPTKRAWSAILWDTMIDSADDVLRHIRRQVQPTPAASLNSTSKPVILVLGSGWGAHALLKVIDTDTYSVCCVSKSNHFLFTPMLPSSAVGTVEFRSLLEPVRVANPCVSFAEAAVDAVDLDKKVASCTSVVADAAGRRPTFDIAYDVLVVAVGERPASFGVPGVKEHGYFMKDVTDAVRLRKRIQEVFELAALPGTSAEEVEKLLHFVVVGGGPTGVEFAGTLGDFLRQDLKKKYPALIGAVRVTLLQSAQTILTQFDARLAQRALDNFRESGVEVRTGVRVTEVTAEEVVLGSGERIQCGLCVWSAGNAPQALVQAIAGAIPAQAAHGGRKLAVDPFLRVIGASDVVALGDCSLTADRLPPTAQVAAQQGAYVAHLINRRYSLGEGGTSTRPPYKPAAQLSLADRVFGTMSDTLTDSIDDVARVPLVLYKKPFEFLSLGILAAIGNAKAVAQVEVFDLQLPLWGNPAFLLWRSVYITKQVSFRNRVLILFDWMKAQVFGRDLSQF